MILSTVCCFGVIINIYCYSSALRCAGVAIRCTSTFLPAAPNCFCPGVINIHELSPATELKLVDDENLLLAATCCIVKQQRKKRRRRRIPDGVPALTLDNNFS